MLKTIKNYTFNEGIRAQEFEKVKFHRNNNQLTENKIQYVKTIYDDIELQIDLSVDDNGKIVSADTTNMLVVDSGLMIPYSPFYDSDNEFEYLNEVVHAYNGEMDNLVEAGICKEKVKK